jgi:putative ABC transport system ATP-binding protein
MDETVIVSLKGVGKTFNSAGRELQAVANVDIDIKQSSTCAFVGPSGSGKTTLLGLCAGLDRPTSGSIQVVGQFLERLNEDEIARHRGAQLGFVFQSFRLLPTLTALENVMVPAELLGIKDAASHAREFLQRVGLSGRADHYPAQLSGGEKQRVALARAFIHKPKVLIADEPTGNLDAETSAVIQELLFTLNRESGTTLIIATHDHELAQRCERVFEVRAGSVSESSSVVS